MNKDPRNPVVIEHDHIKRDINLPIVPQNPYLLFFPESCIVVPSWIPEWSASTEEKKNRAGRHVLGGYRDTLPWISHSVSNLIIYYSLYVLELAAPLVKLMDYSLLDCRSLLYQAIHRRNAQVHRVKPANAPDLLDFVNDLEFHITTISSMSCAQVVAPSTIAMGTPGFMDFRVLPLSTLLTYSCQNTSEGPSITLKCNGCRIPPRDHYVSWQFVDLPRQPAAAVGFQFNLTAKEHGDDKDMSFVSGTLSSDNYIDTKLKTFRGPDSNVLKIQLFPQIYNNLRGLKLLQPLVQDFTQGSTLSDLSSLNASLQNPRDGVINTTLYISYLSDYIVEISNENVLGPGEHLMKPSKVMLVPVEQQSFLFSHWPLTDNDIDIITQIILLRWSLVPLTGNVNS